MRFNRFGFAHPVMGLGDAVQSALSIHNQRITQKAKAYDIRVELIHDNDDIKSYIESGLAEYVCEVSCSGTLYRRLHSSCNGELTFEIGRADVRNRVEMRFSIIVSKPISGYANSRAHPDYANFDFDLKPGEPLAYFGELSFDATVVYGKFRAAAEILTIERNDSPSAVVATVDASGSRIVVTLPERDYDRYIDPQISRDSGNAVIFHSSVVLNALLVALYTLHDGENKETRWAKTLVYKIENDSGFGGLTLEDKSHIPEIAQRLIGLPFSRLLDNRAQNALLLSSLEE